jgi:hypothetical protein
VAPFICISDWGHDKIGAIAYAKLDETVNMRFPGDPRLCGLT